MKYWVYINNKVDGPYDENSLVTVAGFTPETLICSEEVASGGGQEWVKASSVFEFDEAPAVPEPAPAPAPVATAAPAPAAADTQALLARLDALSGNLASLQAKLDSMQSHLDQALEENKKLAQQQMAQQQANLSATPQELPVHEEAYSNTITLTQPSFDQEQTPTQTAPTPAQEEPKEEELIIQSALNSMYGGKPEEKSVTTHEDESFHDLVTGETSEDLARAEEEEAVHDIETQLHFTPVGEDEPVVKSAVITTPSLFEAEKDALINELTSSPKEDVLDQIITEHQQEQSAELSQGSALSQAGENAAEPENSLKIEESQPLTLSTDKEDPSKLEQVLPADQMPEDVLPPAVQNTPAAQSPVMDLSDTLPPVQTTDNSDIPVTDIPNDLPQQQEQAEQQPEIPVADMPEELPQPQQPSQAEKPEMLPADDIPDVAPQTPKESTDESVGMLSLDDLENSQTSDNSSSPIEETQPEELVPAKNEEPLETISEEPAEAQPVAAEEIAAQEPAEAQPVAAEEATAEEPAEAQPVATEEATAEEPAEAQPVAAEEATAQEPAAPSEIPAQEPPAEPVEEGGITEKDLQDAFGDKSSADNETPLPIAQEDFIGTNPDELTEIELKQGATYLISDFVPPAQVTDDVAAVMKSTSDENKKDVVFQDMLAAATVSQSAKPLNTDGLPADASATQVNLENTIQAKRGAALDIKTVPMVPDPTQTDRLDVSALTDENAQHAIKKQGLAKSTKLVIGGLLALLVIIILYVVLGFLHLLPASVNILASKKQDSAATQTTQDILNEEVAAAPVEEAQPAEPTPQQQALEKVQNFSLPNDSTLKGFIESKHKAIDPELITWEITDAVEPDNYSVTVKIPPENPQSFKTVYRFNYNLQTGMLDPTISDAKNLLDQAYGKTQEVQEKPAEKTPAKRKTGTRRTSRKR